MNARLGVATAWLRRVVRPTAILYPIALLGLTVGLRTIGEGWWGTTVGLYLPRIVFAAPLPPIAIALSALRMRRLLWMQGVSLFLIVFPLMGFVLPRPTFRDPHAPVVRVLSFNINSAYGGVAALLEEIDRYSPDVVFLQEARDVDELGGQLRSRYPTVSVSNQFIVATRYPILSTFDPDKLSYAGRLRSPRFVEQVLETPLGRIAFYNVHPISPRGALFALRGTHGLKREIVSGRLFSGSGAPGLDENTGLRTLQIQAVAEAAGREREAGPVVIAGDTNLPGLSEVLHRYLAQYEDGFVEAGWGFGYTFPTDHWRPWMRIDRILATRDLRFVRFEVGHSFASDHRCVVAELQRRDR